MRSLLGGFESFGGGPLIAVFDDPETVVFGRDGGAGGEALKCPAYPIL